MNVNNKGYVMGIRTIGGMGMLCGNAINNTEKLFIQIIL
jgi:hypothetical protein